MRKKLLTLILGLVFALSGASLFFDASAQSSDEKVIKVAFPETQGISEVYEDGTYGGCVYDWLTEISKYTGWKYEFHTGDINDLLEGMKTGEYDIMGGMRYIEQRPEVYNYPKYMMGVNRLLLIYRNDHNDVKSYDYTTLNGKSIGVSKKATTSIKRLNDFLNTNNLNCNIVEYETTEEYTQCLELNQVDVMLGSDVHLQDHYNVAAQFDADPYYLVTSKNQVELCEELSDAMEAVYAANPDFATMLYNKNFPERYINSLNFGEKEREFIETSGTLKVAVIKDLFPISYTQDGVQKGIVKDLLNLISNRAGLKFELVEVDSYSAMLNAVKENNADLIGCYMNKETADSGFIQTVNYAALDSVTLRNKKSAGKTDNLIMAAPADRDTKPHSDSDTVVYYDKYAECVEAVNKGKADYTRMPAAFIEELYAKEYYVNITLASDANAQENLALAMAAPANVTMYSVLSKTLNNISAEESASLISNNLWMLRDYKLTLKSMLIANPFAFLSVCIGIVALVSVIIILISINRMHTRVMRLKLEKAEETSRAKSLFLSRMSHEIRTPMNAIIGLTNLARMTGEATPAVDKNLEQIDSSAKFLMSLLNDVLDMTKIESDKMTLDNAPFDIYSLVRRLENMFRAQVDAKKLSFGTVCNVSQSRFIGDKMRIQQILTNLMSNACKFTDNGGSILLSIVELSRNQQDVTLRFSVKDTGIGIKEEDLNRIFLAFEQCKDSNLRAPGTGLGLAISSKMVELMGGQLKVTSTPNVGSEFYFEITLSEAPSNLVESDILQDTSEVAVDRRLNGIRILLAEDNDINAEITVELLKRYDITVDRAEDGLKAVEMFGTSSEGTYSAILMDVNMPVMDGLTATQKIREFSRPDATTIPILAMTASTFQEDRDNTAAAGMNGFLPKPFDVEQLYQILIDTVPPASTDDKE